MQHIAHVARGVRPPSLPTESGSHDVKHGSFCCSRSEGQRLRSASEVVTGATYQSGTVAHFIMLHSNVKEGRRAVVTLLPAQVQL